jgi:hypothetical protein
MNAQQPAARFATGDRVAFTFPYSAIRTGAVIRRWWTGGWCYAVAQDSIYGEWILSESTLQAIGGEA